MKKHIAHFDCDKKEYKSFCGQITDNADKLTFSLDEATCDCCKSTVKYKRLKQAEKENLQDEIKQIGIDAIDSESEKQKAFEQMQRESKKSLETLSNIAILMGYDTLSADEKIIIINNRLNQSSEV